VKLVILLIVSITCVFGCQTTEKVKIKDRPPDWVIRTPNIKGMICSVGMSGPTYYESDAKLYAAENARKELARTLSIEIKTIMIDIATERGNSIDEATVMQVSSWATSAVVENSTIIEYWHDAEGIVSQRKDVTYALGCMPRKFNKDSLKEELFNLHQSKDLKLEDISRTTDEIIDKLGEE
jgi:hypothetical protein